MMTLFGIKKPDEEQSDLKRNLVQGVLVGSGITGSATVIWGIIALIKSQPDKAYKLLETWGPWFFLAMFAVWAANGLMNRGVDVAERLGDRFVDSMDRIAGKQEKLADSQERLATAQEKMAEATQQAAAKDDREAERMATLVEYSAQQSRQSFEAINALTEAVNKIADRVDHLPGKGV